jgi:hypothetical protein
MYRRYRMKLNGKQANEELKAFRVDLANAMKELEKKYDIDLHLGNISYDSTGFHGKLEGKNKTSEGKRVSDPLSEQYARMILSDAGFVGNIPEQIIGSSIIGKNGVVYTIDGISTRRSKMPWSLTLDGRSLSKANTSFIKSFK